LNSTAVLAIAGVEVPAYENEADRNARLAAGEPAPTHRADVLMIFTERVDDPYVMRQDPSNPILLSNVTQVTYGHADFATLTQNSSGVWTFSTTDVRRVEGSSSSESDIYASQWHLARRAIRFPAAVPSGSLPDGIWPTGPTQNYDLQDTSDTLTSPPFLTGEADVYLYPAGPSGLPFDVTTVLGQFGQGYYHLINGDLAFAVFRYDYQGHTYWRRTTNGSSATDGYQFMQDYWWEFGGGGTCSESMVSWKRTVDGNEVYTCGHRWDSYAPTTTARDVVNNMTRWFYPNATNRRTIIDPNPPANAVSRMGSYFLPACNWFQVEYTYDDPSEIVLGHNGAEWEPQLQAPVRWQSVPHKEQMIWSKLSTRPRKYADPNDPRAMTDPIRWPRALRITLRAYGPGGTLDAPVEQVIIHTFR